MLLPRRDFWSADRVATRPRPNLPFAAAFRTLVSGNRRRVPIAPAPLGRRQTVGRIRSESNLYRRELFGREDTNYVSVLLHKQL